LIKKNKIKREGREKEKLKPESQEVKERNNCRAKVERVCGRQTNNNKNY
jgi:hypothetical protein